MRLRLNGSIIGAPRPQQRTFMRLRLNGSIIGAPRPQQRTIMRLRPNGSIIGAPRPGRPCGCDSTDLLVGHLDQDVHAVAPGEDDEVLRQTENGRQVTGEPVDRSHYLPPPSAKEAKVALQSPRRSSFSSSSSSKPQQQIGAPTEVNSRISSECAMSVGCSRREPQQGGALPP